MLGRGEALDFGEYRQIDSGHVITDARHAFGKGDEFLQVVVLGYDFL